MHITLVFIIDKEAPDDRLNLNLIVSQDVSAHLDMHAQIVVLSQPSVALALFSLHLDSRLVTPAHQVIKKTPVHSLLYYKLYTKKQS